MVAGNKIGFKKYLFSWWFVGSYVFLICFFSLTPVRSSSFQAIPSFDKKVHFFIYVILAGLIVNTLQVTQKKYSLFSMRLVGFFFAFSLGMILENIQFFLPYRTFDWADVKMNLFGSLLGCFLLWDTYGQKRN